MDRVESTKVGTGFAELTAGVNNSWDHGFNAFVRGEVGWHPAQNVDLFGFGQADMGGASAGVGARITF